MLLLQNGIFTVANWVVDEEGEARQRRFYERAGQFVDLAEYPDGQCPKIIKLIFFAVLANFVPEILYYGYETC